MDSEKPQGFKQNLPQQQNPHQRLQVQLSDEERKILIECRNEAFWQRCLPLMAISGFALQMAIRKNLVANNLIFVKQCLVGGVAYSIGKLSYVTECKKKIQSRLSPDSSLYKIFIENRQDILLTDHQQQQQPQTDQQQQDNLSNVYDELRKRNRVVEQETVDYSNLSGYDELRMRNRGVAQRPNEQQSSNLNDNILNQPDILPPVVPQQSQQSENRKLKMKLNKYGDLIYESDDTK
jgi:hypothetical protein